MTHLFLDLDGTLLDNHIRIYRVFCDTSAIYDLSYHKFWKWKRKGLSNLEILAKIRVVGNTEKFAFQKKFIRTIEQEKYLEEDNLFSYSKDTLVRLSKLNLSLVLLTARKNKPACLNQLTNLGIIHEFEKIHITEAKMSKYEILRKSKACLNIFVTDTLGDVLEGKKAQILTIAVLSGNHGYRYLALANPDIIINNIGESIKLISQML